MGAMTKARKALLDAGIRRYDGAPCKHGHGTERYAASGACVVCIAEKTLQWKAKNPGKWAENFAAWREKNADADRARCRAWQKANPDKTRANIAKRKAALLRRMPAWADREAIAAVYEQADRATASTGVKHEVDHIIPMQGRLVSGLHIAENLRVLTTEENRRKGNRFG